MASTIESVGLVVLALAGCGALYAVIATWAIWRFLHGKAAAPAGQPSISVLKPLRGDEPELYESLSSFCAQNYDGPLQIIFGAQDAADPALTVANQVRRDHPGADALVVSDPTLHGANRKIGNLINMSAQATGDIVIISDSDVRMPPDGVAQIVAALEQPGVGMIYCLYRGRPTASKWSWLAALDINTRFAPSVVIGEAVGAHPCLGPTMALRADLLKRIGGFEHLANVLADDFELGRAVREAGYSIGCPRMVIDHVFPERSGREMLAHELRWARTIRRIEPAGYVGSFVTHFSILAFFGCLLTGCSTLGVAAFCGLGVFRMLQAFILSRLMGSDPRHLWLLPLRDIASFVVFLGAIFGDRVEWRGKQLRVGRDGAITIA